MKNYRKVAVAIITSVSMFLLVLNAKDSLAFANEALKLCTNSLIPSLFPFMFLATILNNALSGYRFHFLHIISRLCRIPEGSEILFVLGILGGYPVGAQMIANAHRDDNLNKDDAQRMIGFCNNAGPSFIFGVVGPLFDTGLIPTFIWFIQILSAIITGALLSGSCSERTTVSNQAHISVTDALERSVKTMGLICGWVLLFKIVVGFTEQHLAAVLPQCVCVFIAGVLELTNGCIALYGVESAGTRFILSSLFLALGGLCVALQTSSAVKPLQLKIYAVGKCIQGLISVLIAYIIQYFIFPFNERCNSLNPFLILPILFALTAIIFISRKKTVAFRDKLVYN